LIVLGVDPGTQVTGYGVVRGVPGGTSTLVECGVIRTHAGDPLPSRLREIHDGITELLIRHQPAVLSIEDVFYSRNVRTTIVLGHARGVILLAAEQRGVRVHEMTPREIKKAVVGAGGATKEQVQFMVTKLLRLKSAPKPADAADGVAAALGFVIGAHLDVIRSGVAR
jgi:crossover junction endodeoxyribonuclease RuvC